LKHKKKSFKKPNNKYIDYEYDCYIRSSLLVDVIKNNPELINLEILAFEPGLVRLKTQWIENHPMCDVVEDWDVVDSFVWELSDEELDSDILSIVGLFHKTQEKLIEKNDAGVSFKSIADWIEDNV